MKKTSNIFKKVLQSSLLLAPSDCYCIIVSFMFHVLGPNDHSQHSMQISHRRQGLPPLHLDAAAECTQRKVCQARCFMSHTNMRKQYPAWNGARLVQVPKCNSLQ
jgi:hypothetical protein